MLAEWVDVLDDPHERCPFWLALADNRVRDQALRIIKDGSDLARFEHDAKMLAKRRHVLADLAERLGTPQRSPVRIRPEFRSTSPVGPGDVFAYRFDDGRVAYFRAVEVEGDDRDNYPKVEVLDWNDPPTAMTADGAKRVLPTRGRSDLITILRFRSDPDPIESITVIKRGTKIERKRMFPAELSSWGDLEESLTRSFGF